MIRNVADLLAAGPEFHRDIGGRTYSGHLNEEALLFIESHVTPGARTLETGIGYSTVVFALAGASHTAISPSQREADEIREFCRANGIPLDSLTFTVETSDRALPLLDQSRSLDLVLIDGNHGFPLPIIDWHYASSLLAVGGYVLIDDIELWPGRILRDFLLTETWVEHTGDLCVGRTAVFRKISARPQPAWFNQPFVLKRSDLSLLITRTNSLRLARVNPARFTRDVVVRSVRTAFAYGRHLRDPSVPPPFRRRLSQGVRPERRR